MSLNIGRAAERNSYWSHRLGWDRHYSQILRLFHSVPRNPSQFAEAVAQWQHFRRPRLSVDGIIGPNTWNIMQQALGITVAPSGSSNQGSAKNMSRVTDDPSTWGTLNTLNINGYQLEVFGATDRHLSIIRETLSKIPRNHVSLLPRIVVGDKVGGGTITRGGNSVSRPPNPRLELSTGAMNNPGKLVAARGGGKIHITVLHETGHHVDWRLGITRGLNRTQLDELGRWFATIGYRGVTTGSGEARAEVYWRLFALRSTLPSALRTAIATRLGIT